MRTAVSCLTISLASVQFSLVSVEQEVAIGRQAQAQVRKQVPELGGDVRVYVVDIGRQLARHAEGPGYPYSFSIANYREINAFALPGGPIWIHRGAVDAARNESQLAGVLAHEVAHIARRHAADQLTKGVIADGLLSLLGAVLGNDGSARAAQVAAQVLAGGYLLKFSRDDEREADRVGIAIMRRAGWDQRGMVEFLEILRDRQGRTPSDVEVFLSSHPSPASRVQSCARSRAAAAAATACAFRPFNVSSTAFPRRRECPVRGVSPATSGGKRALLFDALQSSLEGRHGGTSLAQYSGAGTLRRSGPPLRRSAGETPCH